MASTKDDIRRWFKAGIEQNATHMIVVCDTFDHEDYPVYIQPDRDFQKQYNQYNNKDMQRIMEVYNLAIDMEQQIAEPRAHHCEGTNCELHASQTVQ